MYVNVYVTNMCRQLYLSEGRLFSKNHTAMSVNVRE